MGAIGFKMLGDEMEINPDGRMRKVICGIHMKEKFKIFW